MAIPSGAELALKLSNLCFGNAPSAHEPYAEAAPITRFTRYGRRFAHTCLGLPLQSTVCPRFPTGNSARCIGAII
jgi:hypothetical protein